MRAKVIGYKKGEKKDKTGRFAIVDVVKHYQETETNCHGVTTDKIWLWNELADMLTPTVVGQEINVFYDCGFNGKAVVAGIEILPADEKTKAKAS